VAFRHAFQLSQQEVVDPLGNALFPDLQPLRPRLAQVIHYPYDLPVASSCEAQDELGQLGFRQAWPAPATRLLPGRSRA
jgi:hypothetical protein